MEVKAFAEQLQKEMTVEIVFWDERFSTAAVTRTLLEADIRRKKRKEVVDSMAAAYILQGYLDSLNNQNTKKL